jgi:hypothetical protein
VYRQSLKSLYYALVQSRLTYCPIILGIIYTKNKKQIDFIEKKTNRIKTIVSLMNILPLFSKIILPYDKPNLTQVQQGNVSLPVYDMWLQPRRIPMSKMIPNPDLVDKDGGCYAAPL